MVGFVGSSRVFFTTGQPVRVMRKFISFLSIGLGFQSIYLMHVFLGVGRRRIMAGRALYLPITSVTGAAYIV
jgi:hypothetical protein